VEEPAVRTRRLPAPARVAIVVVAVALVGLCVLGAVAQPVATPLYALGAFVAVLLLLPLRRAAVSLAPQHLVVQNLVRTYALPLAGIRQSMTTARGGVTLVVYFHPDYPAWPEGPLPPGWRARHRRKRLRQIHVYALSANDEEMLGEIMRRAAAAREAAELAQLGGTGRSG
jgi:hypothetical protein